MRGKDLNAPKWVEAEKIRVAGDNVGRVAADADFEKLVVL
jgi:hypothetical protein